LYERLSARAKALVVITTSTNAQYYYELIICGGSAEVVHGVGELINARSGSDYNDPRRDNYNGAFPCLTLLKYPRGNNLYVHVHVGYRVAIKLSESWGHKKSYARGCLEVMTENVRSAIYI